MNMETIAPFVEIGVLGGGFIVMLRWMMTRFETELKTIVKTGADQTRTINNNTLMIVALQKTLLAHDLTASGINPGLGADIDERANGALKKYGEILVVLESMETTLQRQVATL